MSEDVIDLDVLLTGKKKLSQGTVDKLRKASITTVNALCYQVAKDLADKAGMGEETAESAIKLAQEYSGEGFITGDQVKKNRSTRTRLTTSVEEVDWILKGGIESETITEIAGENGAGKTQICHQLAVNAQLPVEQGGLNGKVAWVDTEDTFRPERIEEICETRGYDGEEMLKNIHHGLARNTLEQKLLIETLYALVPSDNIKLIIVDSMIGHLRSEYLGRGNLSVRQNELQNMLDNLMNLAQAMKITVVYTNQIISNPAVMYGNPDKPTGGNIMGHKATMRTLVRKGRQNTRIFSITKSAYIGDSAAAFMITAAGIDDTDDYKKDKEKRRKKEEEKLEADES